MSGRIMLWMVGDVSNEVAGDEASRVFYLMLFVAPWHLLCVWHVGQIG